jgi:hypothetical protein
MACFLGDSLLFETASDHHFPSSFSELFDPRFSREKARTAGATGRNFIVPGFCAGAGETRHRCTYRQLL